MNPSHYPAHPEGGELLQYRTLHLHLCIYSAPSTPANEVINLNMLRKAFFARDNQLDASIMAVDCLTV
jgi:hypothetical protein